MSARVNPAIRKAIEQLPEVLQESTFRWFARFAEEAEESGETESSVEILVSLVRLVAVSEFAAATMLRELPWVLREAKLLQAAPGTGDLDELKSELAGSDESVGDIKARLRQFRNRYMLRLLWREVENLATLDQTLSGLTTLADGMLDIATRYATRQLAHRFGALRDEDGHVVPLIILGMGKLGGNELNFSSDIDIIFVYPAEGDSDGERSISAAEYFTRLARNVAALLGESTSDGFVFRVDTRLRPFGDSGPPVVSFAALESYLLQHGRGWERYAYVKARIVGPRPDASVAQELCGELIEPFVYRRYLDYGIFESLRDMHTLITAEVRRRDLTNNIKLGPGGIREIEFIVQSLQLVRGGSRPELKGPSLQLILPQLVGRGGLTAGDVEALHEAYRFLRRLENFIQGMRDRQTHDLPTAQDDRERLCIAMGLPTWNALCKELDRLRQEVSRQFDALAFRERDAETDDELNRAVDEMWGRQAGREEWTMVFDAAGFAEPENMADILLAFEAAQPTQRIDKESNRRLQQFIPRVLCGLRERSDPVATLRRLLAIVEKVLRRSAYIALLNENDAALTRLLVLCEKSGFLSEQIARHPMLLDELLDPHIYSERIGRQELESELAERLKIAGESDSETEIERLSQFQRASLFRIAVADFNGTLPIMRVSDSLTDLAETVLNRALEVAWRDLTARHGEPCYRAGDQDLKAGFGIVAYGKFGGIELSYGSDLDLVFLHDSRGTKQTTNGEKPLDNAVFFMRLARRLVHFLTTQTPTGMLYEIDTRLRPDGRSGVLVTSIEAFERYQEDNAWTWEHQALLRTRPVAGTALIAREFERIRAETLMHRVRRDTLLEDVVAMRRRMREQLDKSTSTSFDLKQGIGGIADIEFLVQYLVLANADRHRSLIHYPDNIRQLATLAAAKCLPVSEAEQLQEIYRAYRLRSHHLSLDDRPPIVDTGEFGREREFVSSTWQRYLQT